MIRWLTGMMAALVGAALCIFKAVIAVLRTDTDPAAPHYLFILWGGFGFILLLTAVACLFAGIRRHDLDAGGDPAE